MDADLPPGWLDVAGFLEGTLKSSLWVNILRHYERHFAHLRHADIEILEIGVNDGSSLNIWKRYFTKAKFIGADINPACRRFHGDRVIIEIGSQDDPEFLQKLVKTYNPTIMIDDGSHLAHHIPFTFEFLFPFLPPGGFYVIEDMFFHFEAQPNAWMGHSATRPNEYLFDIVRSLFIERPEPATNHGMKAYLRSHVDEIAFAPLGVAFIRKKLGPPPLDDRVAMGERYAEGGDRPILWARLAEYLLRNEGASARAEAAARKAVRLAPTLGYAQRSLAVVLRARGDMANAAVAADKAVELNPNNSEFRDLLGDLCLAQKDYAKAEVQFRKIIALGNAGPHVRRRLDDALRGQGKAEPQAKT